MWDQLTKEEQKQISEQLDLKGHTLTDAIRGTAMFVFMEVDSFGKDGIALYDATKNENDLLHVYLFTKDDNGPYQLDQIRTSLKVPNSESSKGIEVIRKEYFAAEGDIPTRDAIERELLQIVERRYIDEELRFNKPIRQAFNDLGFHDFGTMLDHMKRHGNLTYFSTSGETFTPGQKTSTHINYEFVVVSPRQGRDPYISLIKASLADGSFIKNSDVPHELAFSRQAAPLPNQQQMASMLMESLAIKPQVFDRVKELFKFGEDSRAGPASQRKHRPK
ncbi:hypothetical protein [Dinghuibacter silviterrae]|uniref:Uncharacterized protein n=1 Tax=Dinghuibacter silviterrae TaxID=1539049 RepID=A0A4R8DHQ9_9BACT|nr:hypothetical protein [Dinghuibacter silviterrae]TDW97067.1 hypothetical protein EDB95_4906 [Dinghuibacter silviterrae]